MYPKDQSSTYLTVHKTEYVFRPPEHSSSYEDIAEKLEMTATTETTALAAGTSSGRSKFIRQQSTMETPLDSSGVVKMTCWF